MEYTQWAIFLVPNVKLKGLNPCCNGIYSMRGEEEIGIGLQVVLILVVMEYTQWATGSRQNHYPY